MDVLFERFVSRERNEAPDIDIDFEHERREEVIQYIFEKYGRQRAGMTAEVITYRPRSAVRDVGKALGLSADRVDALAKAWSSATAIDLAGRCAKRGSTRHRRWARLLWLVRRAARFSATSFATRGRHGDHARPVVRTGAPENAAMPDRTVIEWDKDDLDTLGILKVDCLALGMLTAIRSAFDLVERHTGRRLTLANVPSEDPACTR